MSAPPPTCIVAADAPGSPTVPPPLVGIESDLPTTQPPRADDSAASQRELGMTHPFECFDCKFQSHSARKMVKHCRGAGHRRSLPCIACMSMFPSKEELDRHCTEVDIPAHRYCGRGLCNTIFPTIELYQAHCRNNHEFLPPLVSPEVRRLKKEIAREASLLDEEKRAWEREMGRRRKVLKAQKKREKAKKKREEAAKRRQELLSMGPVQCHTCSKEFGTPGDYAMHLESGTHRAGCDTSDHPCRQHRISAIGPYRESSLVHFSLPKRIIFPGTGDMDGSWVILRGGSSPGSLVPASSVSNVILSVESSPVAFHTTATLDPATTYIPNSFVDLGIPHACCLCFKTFRTTIQLTAHMNSPAHDPDAFKCPNPKCGRHFALVSGLIQHLEYGTCNLASAGEIFERFALLTTKFSKYLAA